VTAAAVQFQPASRFVAAAVAMSWWAPRGQGRSGLNPLRGVVEGSSSSSLGAFPAPSQVLSVVGGAAVLVYILFQKKVLPKPVARIVARLYFYPTIPLTILTRLGNYFTEMDDTVVLGAAPLALLGHPTQLYSQGVRGVINMCEEYSGPLEEYKRLGIKQLRLPTVDHSDPDVQDIIRGVEFIREFRDADQQVLVHCKSGHGRSSAVVMAWLVSEGHGSPEAVQRFMLSRRRVRRALYEQESILSFTEKLREGKLPWLKGIGVTILSRDKED
jgi:atypical dual specificity phosphatase